MTFPSQRALNQALYLRDFFYSSGYGELALAMAPFMVEPELPFDEARALEYEFNKLFVGPMPPVAPPYASVYLEREPRLMAESTLEIRRLYNAFGLKTPGGVPDDFLAYELEAWLYLNELCHGDEGEKAQKGIAWLETHFAAWLPAFVARWAEYECSSHMRFVGQTLVEWLGGLGSATCARQCANLFS